MDIRVSIGRASVVLHYFSARRSIDRVFILSMRKKKYDITLRRWRKALFLVLYLRMRDPGTGIVRGANTDHSGVGRLEFFAVFGLRTEEKKKVTSDR